MDRETGSRMTAGRQGAASMTALVGHQEAGRPSGTARVHCDRNAVSSPLGNGLSLVETFQLRGAAPMPDKQRQGKSPTDSKTTSLRRQLLRAVLAPESLAILPEDDWAELIGRFSRGSSIILCVA